MVEVIGFLTIKVSETCRTRVSSRQSQELEYREAYCGHGSFVDLWRKGGVGEADVGRPCKRTGFWKQACALPKSDAVDPLHRPKEWLACLCCTR